MEKDCSSASIAGSPFYFSGDIETRVGDKKLQVLAAIPANVVPSLPGLVLQNRLDFPAPFRGSARSRAKSYAKYCAQCLSL